MSPSEIQLSTFIHISTHPLTHLGDLAAWKQAEGAILIGYRKRVIGTIVSTHDAKFNAEGVEINIVKDGVSLRISPSNLISLGVLAVREGKIPFPRDLIDKAISYNRERDQARRKKEAADRMSELFWKLQKASASSMVTPSAFTSEDFALCLKWANRDPSKASITGVLSQVESYHAMRLLSARAAELAVAKYYRNLGFTIEDVSVLQVREQDKRWITHDLMVDGLPVDVKNARRSFNNHSGYVEHCVPRFKEARGSSDSVTIVGVLSDYLTTPIMTEGKTPCRILGEVRFEDILKLKSWAQRKYGAFMDINGLWKPNYQPGWIFEYPAAHYRDRPAIIETVTEQLSWLLKQDFESDEIGGLLLALSTDKDSVARIPLSRDRMRILSELREVDRALGYSRPSLFLFVMGTFLESIYKRTDATNLAATLRDFLFVRPSLLSSSADESDEEAVTDLVRGADRPLGLMDPSLYVFNLINALEAVSKACVEQKYRFTGFRMTHPSILRGETTDGKVISLLAFCGGWTTHTVRAKCGNSPLYLGANEICPSCGFLICEKCGFCSKACVLGRVRQEM